jgi:hypothetical protein
MAFYPHDAPEVARFSTERFESGGMAYDAVSRRFVFGDMRGRRLFVLGEGSTRTADLVRAEGAGFLDVTALEIDVKRGDLWVTTGAADTAGGALHRIQLISGRSLAKFEPPAGQPVRLADIAVAASGAVLALDSAGGHIFRLSPQGTRLDRLASLDVDMPTSLAIAESGRVAYVAHSGGMLRLDLETRVAAPVAMPDGLDARGLERLRWHRSGLIAVQKTDGIQRLILMRLNRSGTGISSASAIDPAGAPGPEPASLAVSGDDLYYSQMAPSGAGGWEVLVRRIRLR